MEPFSTNRGLWVQHIYRDIEQCASVSLSHSDTLLIICNCWHLYAFLSKVIPSNILLTDLIEMFLFENVITRILYIPVIKRPNQFRTRRTETTKLIRVNATEIPKHTNRQENSKEKKKKLSDRMLTSYRNDCSFLLLLLLFLACVCPHSLLTVNLYYMQWLLLA